MIRAFVDEIPDTGSLLALGAEERHYLHRVRRLAAGDGVELVGRRDGRRAMGAIRQSRGDALLVEIVEILEAAPSASPVHILASVPKRDLLEDVVRSLSEIGVTSLTPMIAARSVVVPGDAKMARWRRIAEESMRQCGRVAPLLVAPLSGASEAFAAAATEAKLLLDPRADRVRFAEACAGAASITVAVGPEGGFTPDELERAESSGFKCVGLGAHVLRVETAAIVAGALAVDALTL